MKAKLKEWFNRYKYAELAGISVFVVWNFIAQQLAFNPIFTAISTTYLEFSAYYLVMFWVELKNQQNEVNSQTIYQSFIQLIKEFGPAEIIDLVFSRSFFLYVCPIVTGNQATGLLLGKIMADSIFYFFTILSYEKIKHLNNNRVMAIN